MSPATNNGSFDRVGEWSLLKHDIVQYYAETYSNIMTKSRSQRPQFKHYYIDGYAGAGLSIRKATDEPIVGSALRAASVNPPFAGCHLVELNQKRYQILENLCASRPDVETYCGDANVVLPSLVFPKIRYRNHERAFCLLDPYKETDLLWSTVTAAASTQAIDLLIHFPIYSININVLHTHGPDQEPRLNAYWGDDSWKSIAYEENPQMGFFRGDDIIKRGNDAIISAYRERLVSKAGFKATSQPIPMRNGSNSVVYYLIFATPNAPTGERAIQRVARHFINKLKEAKGHGKHERNRMD
jgi:three-Cys-motif partner protein